MSNAMNGLIKHYHDLFHAKTGITLPDTAILCIMEDGCLGLTFKNIDDKLAFQGALALRSMMGLVDEDLNVNRNPGNQPCTGVHWGE